MTKGRTTALVLLAVAVLLATAGRPWITGAVDDAVLGASGVQATGSESAPGLVALALAAAAAVLASLVVRGVARRVALGVGALAGLGAAALTLRVLLDPAGVLGPRAASAVGRADSIPVDATLTPWAYAALVAAVAAGVTLAAAAVLSGRWSDSARDYDRAEDGARGERGQRVAGDWEALSAGDDPTDDQTGDQTDAPGERRT